MMSVRHILPPFSLLAAFTLAVLPACERKGDGLEEGKNAMHKVSLGISLGTMDAAKTKASTAYFTEMDTDNPQFRGIKNVVMIPFSRGGSIVDIDEALTYPVSIGSYNGLYTNAPACLFSPSLDVLFPDGTSSVLVYGRAPGEANSIEEKHKNGSLIPVGFSGGSPQAMASSLGFDLDVMFSDESASDAAKRIKEAMNSIMLGKAFTTVLYYGPNNTQLPYNLYWNETIGDETLRKAYLQITNEGSVIPGSGPLVEALLTNLYQLLKSYESHNTNVFEVEVSGVPYPAHYQSSNKEVLYKDLYAGLKTELLNRFQANEYLIVKDNNTIQLRNETDRTYPEDMGLPSGCAVLRWTPAGFEVPVSDGVEGIAPMDRYCYPPSLYYYANTTIKTTTNPNIKNSYLEKGYTKWSQVLGDYKTGPSVDRYTTGVALVEPLNYAVGTLVATVQASRLYLQDNDGLVETTVRAEGEKLPVTGVILGRQYDQNYDFTPKYTKDGEYFLYDNQIPGVYLTTSASAPIRTLSLPTPEITKENPERADVYFTLEFRNDTGETFFGADGRVLPGRKFYMVGKLELPRDASDRKVGDETLNSVFVKDHYTTVTCTINSLAGAYNAIPDLGKAQLVVGIQTKVNWTLSTPTTLLLE